MGKNKVGAQVWVGRGLSVLAAIPFLMSSTMKFMGGPQMAQGWAHFGWPDNMLLTVAVLEAMSVILYLIPQVSILGGIVLTGYLGGAIATHLRLNEPVYIHVAIGVCIWAGLYLREHRLRTLIPIRKM